MTARPRIILAVDDAKLGHRLRRLFEAHGYHVQSTSTHEEALLALNVSVPQLVVVHAPRTNEPEDFLGKLRGATAAPIIVLTAATGEMPVVQALAAGADDAIPPPHRQGEVIARVELALRRPRPSPECASHLCDDLKLDPASRELIVDGRGVHLTGVEYRLLEQLLLADGRLVQHDDLLASVWGPAHRGRVQYLRVYIGRLRQKIERAGVAGWNSRS